MISPTRTAAVVLLLLGSITLPIILVGDWLEGSKPQLGSARLLASIPAWVTLCIGAALIGRGRHRPLRARSAKLLLLLVGCATSLSAVLAAALTLEPGRAFAYDSTTGLMKANQRVVKIAGRSRTGVCRCTPNKAIRITLPGGFETRLSIYDKGGPAPRPGLVVAHGNTWKGSDLSTYRLLASRLAEKGHIVVTLDFPGFGRSDDPFGQGPSAVADAYDRPAQLHAAIDYLIANTQVDRTRIALFGHSGGANWAMRAAISHSDLARVAVMVAPPPAREGDSDRDSPEYAVRRGDYFARRFREQHRFVYGTDIPEWFSWDMTLHDVRYGDDVWALFADSGHKPILLVLGERDQPDGHEAVLAQFASVAGSKDMLLLTRADHYANTAQSLGFVFYDIDVAAQLVDGLAAWLDKSG